MLRIITGARLQIHGYMYNYWAHSNCLHGLAANTTLWLNTCSIYIRNIMNIIIAYKIS